MRPLVFAAEHLRLHAFLDVGHRRADGLDLLRVFVFNFAAELTLELHNQLDKIKRVGFKVIPEVRLRRHFAFFNAEQIDDNFLYTLFD